MQIIQPLTLLILLMPALLACGGAQQTGAQDQGDLPPLDFELQALDITDAALAAVHEESLIKCAVADELETNELQLTWIVPAGKRSLTALQVSPDVSAATRTCFAEISASLRALPTSEERTVSRTISWEASHESLLCGNQLSADQCLQRCRDGELDFCSEAGLLIWLSGDTGFTRAQAETSSKLLQNACANNHAPSCNAIAEVSLRSELSEAALLQAVGLLEKSCELGNADGCERAGWTYAETLARPGDEEQARLLYRKGCDLGDVWSCYHLAHGLSGYNNPDSQPTRALNLYLTACQGGLIDACGHAAYILVREDKYPATDVESGHLLWAFSCANDETQWCAYLGEAFVWGFDGVAVDEAHGIELMKKGCDDNNGNACRKLAVAYAEGRGVRQDLQNAADLRLLACGLNDGQACKYLADQYVEGSAAHESAGTAVIALYRKACLQRYPAGCEALYYVYSEGKLMEPSDADTWLMGYRSCELGLDKYCDWIDTTADWARENNVTPTESAIREALQPEQTARIVIPLTTSPLRNQLNRLNTEYSKLDSMPCTEKDQALKRLRKEFLQVQTRLDEMILSMKAFESEILIEEVTEDYLPVRQQFERDPGCIQ